MFQNVNFRKRKRNIKLKHYIRAKDLSYVSDTIKNNNKIIVLKNTSLLFKIILELL